MSSTLRIMKKRCLFTFTFKWQSIAIAKFKIVVEKKLKGYTCKCKWNTRLKDKMISFE